MQRLFDIALLEKMIQEGYLNIQKHPEEAIFIYNYSAKAQYEGMWNEVTLACRGLIMDEEYKIIARPFPKFFNLGEQENQIIPNETFEVMEKVDGSLGILYWLQNKPFIASRGSFTSSQAQKANQMLYTIYKDSLDKLEQGKTYLFEIIYPENRIVVDYGKTEALVLLAIIDNETGLDLPLSDLGFPIVKYYHGIRDIHTLKHLERENEEGFVIKFAGGLRYKVKFKEYLRLHRLLTQTSNLSIWEYMKENQSFEMLLERIPDEFYDWVKQTVSDLERDFRTIEAQCKKDFIVLEDRKATALHFLQCKYPKVLFAMLDERDYKPIIWQMIRPTFQKAFTNSIENI